MKIDRLLSIVVYLLNRDLVSAGELAERFEVSLRTIQRDMDAIGMAGIPIYAVQGPRGGYGILESFKMDNRLIGVEDFYHIVTSLSGLSSAIEDAGFAETLEKIQSLLPRRHDGDLFSEYRSKLDVDFSVMGGDPRRRGFFRGIRRAVDAERLIRFDYTNNRAETRNRTVEPMTVAFRWRSWYLYGWCRLRDDYRLFRISRIKNLEVLEEGFQRRSRTLTEYLEDSGAAIRTDLVEGILRFTEKFRVFAEEYHEVLQENEDGSVDVRIAMPDGDWLVGYVLSWGPAVTVVSPPELRERVVRSAEALIARNSEDTG